VAWYVAKHKNVSHLLRLIDDTENRSFRQCMSTSLLPELQQGETDSGASSVDGRPLLVDPLGNVPMKISTDGSSRDSQCIVDASITPYSQATRCRRSIGNPSGDADAPIVWTKIRTF
jgi:hypothetical protein